MPWLHYSKMCFIVLSDPHSLIEPTIKELPFNLKGMGKEAVTSQAEMENPNLSGILYF